MLVVTIEIFPGGSRALRRTIGTLHVGNESDLADVSNYRVFATRSANPLIGQASGAAEFMVLDHNRRQEVWYLLQRVCKEALTADWVVE